MTSLRLCPTNQFQFSPQHVNLVQSHSFLILLSINLLSLMEGSLWMNRGSDKMFDPCYLVLNPSAQTITLYEVHFTLFFAKLLEYFEEKDLSLIRY